MQIDYETVTGANVAALDTAVTTKLDLEEGWETVGGPYVEAGTWHQAMARVATELRFITEDQLERLEVRALRLVGANQGWRPLTRMIREPDTGQAPKWHMVMVR